MHRSEEPTRGQLDVTLLELPFFPAGSPPVFVRDDRTWSTERPSTVRCQTYEPRPYYPDQFLVEVDSDEMAPRLCKGDWLRCHRVPPTDWTVLPAGVYAFAFDDQFVIRRLKTNTLRQTHRLTTYADNPTNARPLEVPGEQLKQIWRILEIVSGAIG